MSITGSLRLIVDTQRLLLLGEHEEKILEKINELETLVVELEEASVQHWAERALEEKQKAATSVAKKKASSRPTPSRKRAPPAS